MSAALMRPTALTPRRSASVGSSVSYTKTLGRNKRRPHSWRPQLWQTPVQPSTLLLQSSGRKLSSQPCFSCPQSVDQQFKAAISFDGGFVCSGTWIYTFDPHWHSILLSLNPSSGQRQHVACPSSDGFRFALPILHCWGRKNDAERSLRMCGPDYRTRRSKAAYRNNTASLIFR